MDLSFHSSKITGLYKITWKRSLIPCKCMWCTAMSLSYSARTKPTLTLLSRDCWLGLRGVLGTLFDPPPSHPVIHLVTPPWSSVNNWKIVLKEENMINTRKENRSIFTWFQMAVTHALQVHFPVSYWWKLYIHWNVIPSTISNKTWGLKKKKKKNLRAVISQTFSILIWMVTYKLWNI